MKGQKEARDQRTRWRQRVEEVEGREEGGEGAFLAGPPQDRLQTFLIVSTGPSISEGI